MVTPVSPFDAQKKKYLKKLYKPDRSKKGNVDSAVVPLIDAMNDLEDFYTTSSCAGRINLLIEPESGCKKDVEWQFVSHDTVSWKELAANLQELPEETLWFRMEGLILHVAARDEASANRMLQLAREAGMKHAGLLSTTRRYLLELIDSERIDVPVAKGGELIVDEKFLKFLLEKANKKLARTRSIMEKFRKKLPELISKRISK